MNEAGEAATGCTRHAKVKTRTVKVELDDRRSHLVAAIGCTRPDVPVPIIPRMTSWR